MSFSVVFTRQPDTTKISIYKGSSRISNVHVTKIEIQNGKRNRIENTLTTTDHSTAYIYGSLI